MIKWLKYQRNNLIANRGSICCTMLLVYSEQLHDGNFSPGRVSAWAEISARAEFIVNKSFKCTRTVIFLSDCFLNAAHSLTQVQERQKDF